MPGRPPKPFQVLITEKKSHRTKKELEQRKNAEEALLTGISLKEWTDTKDNPVAHKEFTRLRKLLKIINHNDALYEAVINRYCQIISECKNLDTLINSYNNDLKELKEEHLKGELDFLTYLDQKGSIQNRIMAADKAIMDKRKMLLQIERENIMTILAALKAVPRKEPKKQDSAMAAFLNRKQAGNGSQ